MIQPLENPAGLNRAQRCLLKFGRAGGIMPIGGISIFCSVGLTVLLLWLNENWADTESRNWALVVAVAVPAVVGPLVGAVVMDMLLRLQAVLTMLAEQASTDALTGLHNRRGFEAQAGRLLALAGRQQVSAALMMLDIDHFKRVNDVHGHLAGDAVLREVARLCREGLRETDLAARFGGEEFVVLLPACAPASLERIGQDIRSRIANAAMVLPSGEQLGVTVSIGISVALDADNNSLQQLLRRADEQLYRAKHAGRNSVHVEPSASSCLPGAAAPAAAQLS